MHVAVAMHKKVIETAHPRDVAVGSAIFRAMLKSAARLNTVMKAYPPTRGLNSSR